MKTKHSVFATIAGIAGIVGLFLYLQSRKRRLDKTKVRGFNHKNARGEKHIRAVMKKAGSDTQA
jgi:hypothetical protein